MSRVRVLSVLAACAVSVPVVAGHTDPARGADTSASKGKDQDKVKGKDKSDDKGSSDDAGKGQNAPAPTPAPAPAPSTTVPAPPAPAPSAPAKGKDKSDDKGKSGAKPKGPKNGPTSTAPATTAAPSPTAVPGVGPGAAPGASAAPVVAFDAPVGKPAIGRSVGVAAATGMVIVHTADGGPLHALDAATAIPTGARVDARAGTVELTTAVDADGTAQTATFTGGIFDVHQDKATGLTRLRLAGGDFAGCRGVHRAAKKRKPVRSLWGKDDNGRFQTAGKGAVGTVRGTRWLTEDFCDGTRTTVAEGAVAVRDLRTGKTHVVRAGHSYFARYKTRP